MVLQRIKSFFDETDIYILVIAPPILGFGGFLAFLFIMEKLCGGRIPQAYFEIGLGVAFLIECIAGIAEVYKKEMPSVFGKVIKGNIAVISGVTIVIIMGFGSILAFAHGISILISR